MDAPARRGACGGPRGEASRPRTGRPGGYDLAISMYALAEVPAVVRFAYFHVFLTRSTRGWVSDHDRHLAKVHADAFALARPAEHRFLKDKPGKHLITSLLMPSLRRCLQSSTAGRSTQRLPFLHLVQVVARTGRR